MKLSSILHKNAIIPDLKSTDKRDVLNEFAELAGQVIPQLKKDEVLEVLMNREELGSTAVGHGIAIPHGKIAGIKDILALFGRSKEGVDFQAHDEKPTNLFFVLLAPEAAIGNHLQALARLSRLLKEPELREELVQVPAEELYDLLIKEDNKL